jgi:splicing factor 3B subunit 1
MRVAIGPIVLLHYVLQGLFHPARKVRDVYWKVYNMLYIGSQDALVAAYPRLEVIEEEKPSEKTKYVRHELFYIL